MLELQHKIKRQIEILGLAIENTSGTRDIDLAEMFGRDIPTIKRDMQDLRKIGIAVHSQRKGGVCLAQPIDAKTPQGSDPPVSRASVPPRMQWTAQRHCW